jgi:hypothetical protein
VPINPIIRTRTRHYRHAYNSIIINNNNNMDLVAFLKRLQLQEINHNSPSRIRKCDHLNPQVKLHYIAGLQICIT